MKKIFLMLVAALMVGTATVNAQIWGGQLILRGGCLLYTSSEPCY